MAELRYTNKPPSWAQIMQEGGYTPETLLKSGIRWDGSGQPYNISNNAPLTPAQFGYYPEQGQSSFLRHTPSWNADKQAWTQDLNWGGVGALGAGSVLTLGALDAAMPGLFGAGTTSSGATSGATTGSGVGIGETAATTGLGSAAKGGILGKVGSMATGGMSFKDLAKLSLLQFGLGTAGDLMGGSQQKRRPFNDAQGSLDSARDSLKSFMPQLQARLGTPTKLKAPRMPNMSFSGGPMPFKVGIGGSSPVEEAQSILDLIKGRK